MAKEIERKFLVSGDAWRTAVTGSRRLAQGYLSSNAKATVRVRIFDDAQAVITIKGPTIGISRAEFEYPIPLDDGLELLRLAGENVVLKTRHIVPHAGLTWEVDTFEAQHAGLVMAEVELESAGQFVDLPSWVGQEVSHDDRYANASLSRKPGVPAVDPDAA
ncbi:CYTH domain-containing protein [Devosia lucknowensis]|uniref:CYTH domain-containing protein n=1 Tax=Devosia lucknowensis TaxID=1096929 RepID=A0A1Y6F068_9HYPH|nr:CYTH domain-containing protein [Devosia lucknowensis]SMQ66162.1 CYTH domain-containing protein [Devosia lucknowensis]